MSKIEIKTVRMNDEEIYIASESTCFCQLQGRKLIDIKELLKKYNELIKLCKENKIKLSYKNHYKKTIKEQEELYKNEANKYINLYNELCTMWKDKLNKGIYSGYTSDIDMIKIKEVSLQMQEMGWRSSALFRIEDINNRIIGTIENIESGCENYYSICL
jgi:hypothetical protein